MFGMLGGQILFYSFERLSGSHVLLHILIGLFVWFLIVGVSFGTLCSQTNEKEHVLFRRFLHVLVRVRLRGLADARASDTRPALPTRTLEDVVRGASLARRRSFFRSVH